MLTSDIQMRLNCVALYAVTMLLILGLTPIEESPSVRQFDKEEDINVLTQVFYLYLTDDLLLILKHEMSIIIVKLSMYHKLSYSIDVCVKVRVMHELIATHPEIF